MAGIASGNVRAPGAVNAGKGVAARPAPPPHPAAAPAYTSKWAAGSHLAGAPEHGSTPVPVQQAQVHRAVAQVFKGQAPRQQAAIVSGVLAGNADAGTAKAVRDAVTQMGNRQLQMLQYLPSKYQGPNLLSELGKVASAGADVFSQSAALGAGIGVKGGKGTLGTPGSKLTGVAAIRPMFTAGTAYGSLKGNLGILGNAGKDLYNMPAGTVEGLYNVGNDIYHGHYGNAFHALADPFINLPGHFNQTLTQHPVDTLAMLLGPKALLGRAAGGAARAGMLGDAAKSAASTARADLHLGTIAGEPSPLIEARSYSPDLITKAMQVAREQYLLKRGRNPNVAQPAPRFMPQVARQAFNIGVDAKFNRKVDEMSAVRQMAGRGERGIALDAVRKAAPGVKDSRRGRMGQTATEIANRPQVSGIVSHILQSIVRTPETAIADLTNEKNRLLAAQTGKRTLGNLWNRRQVRDISHALRNPKEIAAAFKAAETIRPTIKTQDAYLVAHGLLDEGQAARRAVLPYAKVHMGAKYDPIKESFTYADGTPLPTQKILDHIKANGVPDPAYIAHVPGKTGPAHFYSAYKLARGSMKRQPFTGKAFDAGAYDHSFAGLAGQVASRAEAVTKASLHDRVVNRLGVSMPAEMRAQLVRQVFKDARAGKRTMESAREEAQLIRQGLFTKSEATQFANAALIDHNHNPVPGAVELTPISTAPSHVLGDVKDLQHPHELGDLSGIELRALSHAIEDAQHSTTRNVTLIPSVAAKRFAEQYAKTDSTMKGIGKVTQQFRRTVLPYSTHWMAQIGSEAVIRGLLSGALNPAYLRDGRQLMKRLQGTEEGRAALMEMVNATFYHSHDPMAVHNPNAGAISTFAHKFPPSKAIITAHNAYANTIGHGMYTLEHQFRVMGLGQIAHQQVRDFGHSWKDAVLLQGKTLDHLATQLKNNPELVAKFGRQIDETFGKYNKFSPKVRAAVQSYAPFLPWYLNAAKYVLWNLPAHHPVATSLLASLRQTVNQDIADGKKAPLGTYAMQELARLSPWGIFSPDSTTPSIAGAVKGQQLLPGGLLPEAQGALYNYAGLNSFGEGPLKGPGGDVKARSGAALAAGGSDLAESLLPVLRMFRELREGGKPAFGTSNAIDPQPKPGPGAGVLNRIFNPFYSFERSKNAGPAYGATGTASKASNTYSIPTSGPGAAATHGKWTVAHTNPAGTGATSDKWKISP